MNYSEKKQRQIALYALLTDAEQALETYSISSEQLNGYLEKLLTDEVPLFVSIRNEIISASRLKGAASVSDHWGISQSCLEKLLTSFPDVDILKKYTDSSCTISPQDMKSWTTVAVQPAGPNDDSVPKKKRKIGEDKRKVTNYSIGQKVEAVREFVKGTNQSETARELQIPAVNLMRWRDKIRKEAFQDPHVDNLYGAQKRGQRNKMFRDLDAAVYEWAKKSDDKSDLAITTHAKSIAKIDEADPVIKETWLKSFKKHFNIE